MARQIDESKPLSASDRQWLTDWGRQDVIARIDQAHGTAEEEVDDSIKADDLRAVLSKNGIDAGDGDLLEAVDAALFGRDPGSKENNPRVNLGDSAAHVAPEPGDAGEEPEDDYADWTNAELKDELGARELSKSGNHDELVDRLRESDASGYQA